MYILFLILLSDYDIIEIRNILFYSNLRLHANISLLIKRSFRILEGLYAFRGMQKEGDIIQKCRCKYITCNHHKEKPVTPILLKNHKIPFLGHISEWNGESFKFLLSNNRINIATKSFFRDKFL